MIEKREPSADSRTMMYLGFIGAITLFAVLRWNSYDAPLTRDEGEYAYAGNLITHGLLPYEHSFLQKPPMVAYTYALSNLVAPNIFWSGRVLASLFAAAATLLLGYVARLEFGSRIAGFAMCLVTPMILLPGLDQFTANTEMFMLLPVMAAVAVYVRCVHRAGGMGHWFAGGLLGAISLSYKYTALPLLVVIFAFWAWDERRRKKPRVCKCGLFALSGAIVASVVIFGPFLMSDGGIHLWDCTVTFNRFYAAKTFEWTHFAAQLQTLWSAWWFLFLIPLLLLVTEKGGLAFWICMLVAAWTTSTGSQYGHYYILIMPFWALLVAVAIQRSASLLEGALQISFHNWLGVVGTATVILAVCWSDVPWILRSKERFAVDKMGPTPCFGSRLVARRIAEISAPADEVCIAGSEPEILDYCHRFSSTRFIITYPLMIPTPLAKSYQLEAINDLDHRRPALIVLARLSDSWAVQKESPRDYVDYLTKLADQSYEVLGGYVHDSGKGRWEEPLSGQEIGQATLLLLKRKN